MRGEADALSGDGILPCSDAAVYSGHHCLRAADAVGCSASLLSQSLLACSDLCRCMDGGFGFGIRMACTAACTRRGERTGGCHTGSGVTQTQGMNRRIARSGDPATCTHTSRASTWRARVAVRVWRLRTLARVLICDSNCFTISLRLRLAANMQLHMLKLI